MKVILSKQLKRTNLIEQTKIRLDKITEIEHYFHQEINHWKSCSKKLSKYVTAFDYVDKVLIALSATNDGVSIISFTSVVGAPVGIARASFTLIFSLTTGIVKKLLSITRNKKKKHDKILMLAKSKLNSIENLISQALNDMKISHEEFIAILMTKVNTRRWKRMWKVKIKNKKLWDWVAWNQRLKTKMKWKTVKNYWAFYAIKKFYFFCVYV